jgi:hypothetical protein
MNETAQAEQTCMMPKPAAQHQRLQPFAGTFAAEVKMWIGPAEPMVSTGTMTCQWHLDGLYLHQDYIGDPSDGPFPAFAGKGYWGYNSALDRYEGFWIDNASTIMQMESGQVDSSGKVWTMRSEVPCPQSGESMKKRSVITLIDEDHNKIEMYFTGADGNEMKCMEINYARRR